MNRLKFVAGDDNLPVNIDDLNGDFDPKEYDRRMNVNNQYYFFYFTDGIYLSIKQINMDVKEIC